LPPDPQAAGVSLTPSVSADGRYVGFSAHSLAELGDYEGYGGPSDAERPAENAYLYDRVTGRIELISRNSAGEPARRNPAINFAGPFGGSSIPSVSADGRYVTFNSDAANLGGPIEPQGLNVYRRDRVKGITRLVSTDGSGEPMGGESCAGTGRNISGDGRYVVFRNRPVEPETQGTVTDGHRVYLWDAETGRTTLVSKVPPGRRPAGSYCPAISLDGSRVGLVSLDPLVPEDTNGTPDVYVYEVATGRLQRISVTSAGKQTYDPNYAGRDQGFLKRAVNLSADGRFAVFDSAAPDLAPSSVGSPRHTPNTTRVYVHDILTGATVLASVSSTGAPLPGDSHMPYISPDGRSVVFLNLGVSAQREVMVHRLR
jgi:Tol biopolymer transport system component